MSRRSLGAYDVVFETSDRIIGYQTASPVTQFHLEPGRLDEVVRSSDVPRVIDNLDAGMGFSRRISGAPLNGYAYCLPGFTRSPGGIFSPAGKLTEITMPPLSGPGSWVPAEIIDSVRFRGNIYLISNTNYILQLTTDGGQAGTATVLPAGFDITSAAVFGNRMYVAGRTSMVYLDGTTGLWSAPATGLNRAQLTVVNWRPLGVPTDILLATTAGPTGAPDQATWVPITADPMVPSNWSAPVPVGADRRFGVNRIVAAPRHAYFLRPDGVFDMDELGVRAFNIAPWVGESVDYSNGAWGLHVGDGLYYMHAHGLAFVPTQGETQYRPEWVHPGWGLPYEGPVRGSVQAGTLHSGWGLGGVFDGSQSYVAAGRRDPQAYGQATHIWHGAEAILPGPIRHMRVYTLEWTGDNPRCLIAIGAPAPAVTRVFWQSLPRTGSAIQEMLWGGSFVPADAASLFLPADPWDRPSSTKTLLQFDMLTERLTDNDTLKAYAAADAETTWTEYGTADYGAYNSFAPLETSEGRYIKTRVDAVGHPILRSLELRSAIGVELREARQYSLILAWDNALQGARARETKDPEQRMLDLQSLLGRVCTLDDAVRGTSRVRVLQVLPGRRVPMGAASRAGAWAATAEVTVSVLDRPLRWNGQSEVDRFDADRTWV